MPDEFSENVPNSPRESPTTFSGSVGSKLPPRPNVHPTSSFTDEGSVSVYSCQCQTSSHFHSQFNPANLRLNDPPPMPSVRGAVIPNNGVRKTTRQIQWKYECGSWPYWRPGDPSTPRIEKFGSAWLYGRRRSLRLQKAKSLRNVLRITAA
jgi:hypothetical protein